MAYAFHQMTEAEIQAFLDEPLSWCRKDLLSGLTMSRTESCADTTIRMNKRRPAGTLKVTGTRVLSL